MCGEEKTVCRRMGIGCAGCGHFVWQRDKEAAAPAVRCYGRGGTCHGLCMEEHGLNASDLGRLLGSRDLGSKILRRERELSKAHMLILAGRFQVDPGLFFV